MRVVVLDDEVGLRVVEDARRLVLEHQLGQRTRFARRRQLLVDLRDVVVVDVRVTSGPCHRTHLQAPLLRHHVREECVAGEVERHAEEHVGTALCHDRRQHATSHVELEHVVARLQCHLLALVGPPGGDHHAPRVGFGRHDIHDALDLVDLAALRVLPVSPLNAVDRAEVAVLESERLVLDDTEGVARHAFDPLSRTRVRDRLPDGLEVASVRPLSPDRVLLQEKRTDVALAAQEPEQLGTDESERDELAGDQRKTLPQIVPNRDAGEASRSGTGTVTLLDAVVVYVTKSLFERDETGHKLHSNEQGASD